MVKGKLIIIEAGDGCGKATQTIAKTKWGQYNRPRRYEFRKY